MSWRHENELTASWRQVGELTASSRTALDLDTLAGPDLPVLHVFYVYLGGGIDNLVFTSVRQFVTYTYGDDTALTVDENDVDTLGGRKLETSENAASSLCCTICKHQRNYGAYFTA